MRFPRQEYWSGLPFPSPGNLPHLGIKPVLLLGRQTLYHWATREAPNGGERSIKRSISGWWESVTMTQRGVILKGWCKPVTSCLRNRWATGNLVIRQIYINWNIFLQLHYKVGYVFPGKPPKCLTQNLRLQKILHCAYIWPPENCVFTRPSCFHSQLPSCPYCFLLGIFFYFWDYHCLGTGSILFFLTGVASVFTLSLCSSVSPLPFCWEIYGS